MKYKVGDKILFRKRIGYVTGIVSDNRYYVSCMGWLWSVSGDEIHQPERFNTAESI